MTAQPSNLQTFKPANLQTLLTWQDAFEAHIVATYNGNTLKAIRQHVRQFEAWYTQAFQRDLDPAALTNYALSLYRAESVAQVQPATWNARLWAITILLNWLGIQHLLEGIEQMQSAGTSAKHRALTPLEYRRLNDALEASIHAARTEEQRRRAIRDRALISLMLQTGARVGEAVRVRWEDVTIGERSGELNIRRGKGGKQRTVQLNKHIRAALSAWRDEHTAPAAGFIFERDAQNHITERTAQRLISDLGTAIGTPGITCHWLRYTAAKLCERHNHERGLNRSEVVRLVQSMLGHTSYDTTDRYLKSGIEERQSAMDWE